MRARGCDSARLIQVVETRAIAGAGTEADFVREVVQYWSVEGALLASVDPMVPELGPLLAACFDVVETWQAGGDYGSSIQDLADLLPKVVR